MSVSVGTFIRDFISLLNPSLSNEVSNVARDADGPGGEPTDPLYRDFDVSDIPALDGETAAVIVNPT